MNENETVMPDEAKIYEISFIFDNRLDEDKALQKLETLKKDIASLKGSFISEETPYMRELSYEMVRVVNNVNLKFNSGYFGWVKFSLPANQIETLNKKLKLDEEVVRYLIIKAENSNDIFTKDIAVFKADPNLNQNKEEVIVVDDGTNLDTTNEDLAEELDEETKKLLDEEVEAIKQGKNSEDEK